jgi:hypothetical protein
MTDGAAIVLPAPDTYLAYTVYHETYWWSQITPVESRPNEGRPCVQIHCASRGGGVKWEFGVVEHDLYRPALKLGIFDEGWEAFRVLRPFFDGLADVHSLDGVRALLDSLGAVDETERVVKVKGGVLR